MQNYNRIYDYITEYQSLVYDIYSKHGLAFRVDYYNINSKETVWDDENNMGGSYESVGKLSGTKWDKYSSLPVYFLEPMTTQFDAVEEGVTKQNETSLVIPDSYKIVPYAGDLVRPRFSFLNKNTDDTYPVYRVTGREISANTARRFWKIKAETYQSISIDQVDENQLAEEYVFFEYTKQIMSKADANTLSTLIDRYGDLSKTLSCFFDPNSCLYIVP